MAAERKHPSPACTCRVDTPAGPIDVPYAVERSRRLRNLRVVFRRGDRVLLRLPPQMSEEAALKFLQSQGPWLSKHLGKLPPPISLHEFLLREKRIAFDGDWLPIEMREEPAKESSWRKQGSLLVLAFPPDGPVDDWLRELLHSFARKAVPIRVARLAERHGVYPGRITIRDQRTRWGSCSGRRTLSLNWRLLLLPPELQDYIILHELAHLTHLNHSPKFWDLLNRYDPASRQHDRRIGQLCAEIMPLGRRD